jgi:hypothetical protein
VQDYARHKVNCYIVEERHPYALAAGMLDLSEAPELRQLIGANAHQMAVDYYPFERIETHNGNMIRRAVALSRIHVELLLARVDMASPGTPRQSCTAASTSQGSWKCPSHALQVHNHKDGAAFIEVTIRPALIRIPPGFDDVWGAALKSAWETALFPGSKPDLSDVAFRLFLEWHGQRTQLCIDIGFGMHPEPLETVCSPTLGDAVTISEACSGAGLSCQAQTSLRLTLAVSPETLAASEGLVRVRATVRDYQDSSIVYATT